MLIPLNKNVLVKQDSAEQVTKGGIHVPAVAQEKKAGSGVVLAIATKARDLLPGVHVGTKVTFQRYAGTPVGADKELLMIEADELLGFEFKRWEECTCQWCKDTLVAPNQALAMGHHPAGNKD